ncbi:RNA polymerase sigma factor [Pseudonocardia sp. CA-107938]|uniref:RNA polymerase sigma factor n=1 Tax=Pseudonocardia sp. CA-107938 TaxID=3240021 RepID=UPI003D8FB030
MAGVDVWAGSVEQSEVAGTVLRAAAGDRAAWDEIVASFSGLIWTIAVTHRLGPADAAEVTQTTWMRLVENLGTIREPERLAGWIATTARRESLRLLRLRGREVVTGEEATFDAGDSDPTPEEHLLDRERDRVLWRAFARLPERCRTLLQLVVVSAPSYVEVAAALDMPVGSIGPTRARCLKRLRVLLDGGVVG